MEFVLLTLITIISAVYCCDVPVWSGFAIFVNQKDSMWYGIGLSIIAAYIFYIIQVYIPQLKKQQKAEIYLKSKIKDYLEMLYELIVIIESVCDIDEENGHIIPKYEFIKIKRSDLKSIWIEQIDFELYQNFTKTVCDKIEKSIYYLDLNTKKIECLQEMFDNTFLLRLCENIKRTVAYTDADIIKKYENLKVAVIKARKIFGERYTINIYGYEQNEITSQLKISNENNRAEHGILRVRMGNKD